MHLGLVGGFGNSISLRGMGPGTPTKLKKLLNALSKHFGALESKVK